MCQCRYHLAPCDTILYLCGNCRASHWYRTGITHAHLRIPFGIGLVVLPLFIPRKGRLAPTKKKGINVDDAKSGNGTYGETIDEESMDVKALPQWNNCKNMMTTFKFPYSKTAKRLVTSITRRRKRIQNHFRNDPVDRFGLWHIATICHIGLIAQLCKAYCGLLHHGARGFLEQYDWELRCNCRSFHGPMVVISWNAGTRSATTFGGDSIQ